MPEAKYVTHKEMSELERRLERDSKEDRHDFGERVHGLIMGLSDKLDDIKESVAKFNVLAVRVENNTSDIDEIKSDIHEIKENINKMDKTLIKWGSSVLVIVGLISVLLPY